MRFDPRIQADILKSSQSKAAEKKTIGSRTQSNVISSNHGDDAYHVSLNRNYESETQQLASSVLAANADLPKNAKFEKPLSLTARLSKPQINFDEFIDITFSDIETARAAHSTFDRKGLLNLLF